MSAADPAAGEKVFGKCKSCHKVDGNNATGPHLNGVVGRAVASVADFGYSDAMKGHVAEAPAGQPALVNFDLASFERRFDEASGSKIVLLLSPT